MYSNTHKIRVRYGETDKMGFVYYGVYAQYYEVGRVELLRSLGVSYKSLEDIGYELPVIDFQIKYKKPAFYDDEITVVTLLSENPSSKLIFNYECFNSNKELLNIGSVTLIFVNSKTKKVCSPPKIFLKKLNSL